MTHPTVVMQSPKLQKDKYPKVVKEEACLRSHYSRLLPEYYLGLANTPRTIKREMHTVLEAKELCLLFQPKLNFTFQILLHGKEIR